MAKKPDRNMVLQRAANLRAILVAHLNGVSGYVSVAEISQALSKKLEELKISNVTLAFQLQSLANNGLIGSTRDGNKNLYCGEKEKKTKVDVKIKSLKADKMPAYKIDVVKGQKRVRITIDDMMFDIGVVNA